MAGLSESGYNLGAFTLGIGGLFTAIGGLSATGAIGRLQRNEPELLTAAVILVLLALVAFGLATLPFTRGSTELGAFVIGTVLGVTGVAWAVTATIRTAGESERPALWAKVTEDGTLIEGQVKASNLPSDERLVLLVEGLETAGDGGWDVYTLGQHYVGPNGDGLIELPVHVRVPPRGFDAVGLKAWTTEEPSSCTKYPRRTRERDFKQGIAKAGTGCVVLPLVGARDVPMAPRISLSWEGNDAATSSIRVGVASDLRIGRIFVLVAGQRARGAEQLYRAASTTDDRGRYRGSVLLPIGRRYRRVCALAYFAQPEERRLPRQPLECPIGERLTPDRVGAELRQPRKDSGRLAR